jgi:hypothetical protein
MKRTMIVLSLVVFAISAAAQAAVYSNGDFEDDLALVPNAGDTAAVVPTGWQYDNYYGYGVDPVLMNVSTIGDGSGGNVGVVFPNWNVEGGWNGLITRYEDPIAAGQYNFTVTLAGTGMTGGGNWITAELWWTSDLADPWGDAVDYDWFAGDWVEFTAADNGTWWTYSTDFEILPGDPAVGTYFSPWIHAENYDGNLIIGEASLTVIPEPMTLGLLGLGALMIRRKKS